MPGSLFVVATPIGNLEDLTFRALRTLKEVDLIAAEDTRRTSRLLAHYDIRKPMVSLREHNEQKEAPRLTRRLQSGESIALVSDAGTPGIADPGARLVAAAREAGITVVPIPGPSAVTTALSAAGVDASEFVFMGFVPRSGTLREEWLDRLAGEKRAVVFFETPHRIDRTTRDVGAKLVSRQIYWFRELTKRHEQLVMSPRQSISDFTAAAGEFVAVVEPSSEPDGERTDVYQVLDMFGRLTDYAGFTEDEASELVAMRLGGKAAAVKKAVKKQRILAKQQSDTRP
jgi:16S rRNA (cytidine1402-2'-O)-methyltransferase